MNADLLRRRFRLIRLAALEAAAKRKRAYVKAVASVAVFKIKKFAANSSLTHALDYRDSRAPPIKFQFLLRLKFFVRSRRIAKNIGWHPKTPVHRRERWLAATPKGYPLVSTNS